jgi:hypothetical protein
MNLVAIDITILERIEQGQKTKQQGQKTNKQGQKTKQQGQKTNKQGLLVILN